MPIAVIYIATGLLFLGVAHDHLPYLPYGYFTFLGIVATVVFICGFLVAFTRGKSLLPWIYLLLAITFNPVIKLPLPHEIWMIVDVAAGTLLFLTKDKIKQRVTTMVNRRHMRRLSRDPAATSLLDYSMAMMLRRI
jgi:hypothetical protein